MERGTHSLSQMMVLTRGRCSDTSLTAVCVSKTDDQGRYVRDCGAARIGADLKRECTSRNFNALVHEFQQGKVTLIQQWPERCKRFPAHE